MEKSVLRISAFLTGLALVLVPSSALAYLSPEQVFGGADGVNSATPPPLPREGEAVVQQQQAKAAAVRTEAQQQLTSTDAEPVDTYVPPDPPKQPSLLDPAVNYEVRMQRIDAAHAAAGNAPTIIISGDKTVIDSNGNVLHSGAPLVTTTGPETTLAFLAMILAGICTFAYAHVRSRALPTILPLQQIV